MSSAHTRKSHIGHPPRKVWGIFTRKERWGLSWQGWSIVFAGVLLTSCVFLFRVYPFLAVTHRTSANVLVVEGWVHEYAIRAGVDDVRHGSCHSVFSIVVPVVAPGP